MSGINNIVRDWGVEPAIVRINTTDTLSVAGSAGYITAQTANIDLANSGAFTWLPGDLVAVDGSDASGLFQISPDFTSLISSGASKFIQVPITAAQFNGMYAAPILLVQSPGLNSQLIFKQLQLAMTFNSADYAAGGVSHVQYDSTADGAGVIASTTLTAANLFAGASTTFTYNAGIVLLPFSTTVNKGLYLSNITQAFTTGDSTFIANVWYDVIPTVTV